MDWNEIVTNWPALTGSILTRWPGADEDTVLAIDGDRGAFVAYISRLEDIPESEAEERVAEWSQTAMPADARMAPVRDSQTVSESDAELAPGEEPLDADEQFGDETEPDQPMGRTL
ncbi:MAG: hypothetical protein V2I65_00390 [Paracoccaceae bacterium]|jgi:hypothetical protein|nr:hypothetical protein [Paracoccaceae bacterium]